MKVRDIMTKSPAVCLPDTSLQEVAKLMLDRDCGGIPIVADLESRRPIGIVTDRDIVVRAVAAGRNPIDLSARDCMTAPVVVVLEDAEIDDSLQLLEEKQLRRILVVDPTGACVGIISQADMAANVSKKDAGELVRKISESSQPRA
jgi:CBS domain-containing protein